jgi:hypothetical protein
VRFIPSWRLAVSAVLILLLAAAGVLGLAVRNSTGNVVNPPGFVLEKSVLAHGIVDQSYLPGSADTASWVMRYFQPIGQEFTPSASVLAGVDVDLRTINARDGDATITVNIRKGTISNPVLATASQIVPAYTPGAPREGLTHFDFPSPLAVTPGQKYVLEVQATTPTHMWRGYNEAASSHPVYPGGQAIFSGRLAEDVVEFGDSDLFFQTYSVTTPKSTPTPIPPTPTPKATPTPTPSPEGFMLPWDDDENPRYFTGGPHPTLGSATKNAIDFSGGTYQVLSIEAGVVAFTGRAGDRWSGNVVVIAHDNGIQSEYWHLASIESTLTVGSRIPRGYPIGRPGCTGDGAKDEKGNCVNHLHLEFRQGGTRSPNGAWNRGTAVDVTTIVLDGWSIQAATTGGRDGRGSYNGTMMKKGEVTRTAELRHCGEDTPGCNGIRNDLNSSNSAQSN